MTFGTSVWPEVIPWVLGLAGLLFLLHLMAGWMEDRGWINYRKPVRRGYGAAMSNAMAEFDALVSPAAEHRIAEERHQDAARSIVPGMEPLDEEE